LPTFDSHTIAIQSSESIKPAVTVTSTTALGDEVGTDKRPGARSIFHHGRLPELLQLLGNNARGRVNCAAGCDWHPKSAHVRMQINGQKYQNQSPILSTNSADLSRILSAQEMPFLKGCRQLLIATIRPAM
jgi:hypothetical protein